MADTKKSGTSSRIFDVAKPATGSTKSAAIPKRAMMSSAPGENSSTTDEKPETEAASPAPGTLTSVSGGKLKIQPISKPEDLKPAEEDSEKPEAVDDTSENDDDTEAAYDIGGNTEPNSHDALKNASTDEQDVVESKAAERQANYEKIISAKTYFLPINQVIRRRSKHVALAGIVLIVLLGLAWLDISLDAGLITIPGVEAPTDFFD